MHKMDLSLWVQKEKKKRSLFPYMKSLFLTGDAKLFVVVVVVIVFVVWFVFVFVCGGISFLNGGTQKCGLLRHCLNHILLVLLWFRPTVN